MKNDLINKLAEEITDYGFNDEYGYYSDWLEGVKPIIQKSINTLVEQIIDDLTITMDRTYRLDKPPFWLIEWIKKFKKEDYKNL